MNAWLDLLVHGDRGASSPPETVVFSLLLAFIVGHVVGWVYMATHVSLSYSRSFVGSLVVLPVIVALMMMLMSGSMLIAFGLLAVFAVVRFRNVLKDTRDTTYILWTIVQGMAVGTLRYSTALVGMACIALILLYVRLTSFGIRRDFDAMLSVDVSGNLSAAIPTLQDILKRHAISNFLVSTRQTGESRSLVSYHLLLRDPSRSEELKQELLQAEQMEDVSLFMQEEQAEV